MKTQNKDKRQTRREFLKLTASTGVLMGLAVNRLLSFAKTIPSTGPAASAFQFRTVSVKRIPELKAWMDQLDKTGELSANETWRQYINSFQYEPPRALPGAQSLIVMSTPLKIAKIVFNAAGRKSTVLIPSGYVDDGLKLADYQNMLYRSGVVVKGSKLERARLPLKQLAVRSGLAEYGKNNITYVDGYGSYHQLLAFYSEQQLEDNWDRLKALRLCKGCSICMKACPTRAIREGHFVIDQGKCITLYNELPGPMPAWIHADAHNALVGCLKCQYACPANEDLKNDFWDLGEVPEAETALLLGGPGDAEGERSLRARLQRIGGGDDLPYMGRNLKLVLKAQEG
jgi:epoxyqueuosine reductase